jgi:hypothetical protein
MTPRPGSESGNNQGGEPVINTEGLPTQFEEDHEEDGGNAGPIVDLRAFTKEMFNRAPAVAEGALSISQLVTETDLKIRPEEAARVLDELHTIVSHPDADVEALVMLCNDNTLDSRNLLRLLEKYQRDNTINANFIKVCEALVELDNLNYSISEELASESRPIKLYATLFKFRNMLQHKDNLSTPTERLLSEKSVHPSVVREFLKACAAGTITIDKELRDKAIDMLGEQPDNDRYSSVETLVIVAGGYKELQDLIREETISRDELNYLVRQYEKAGGKRKDPGECYRIINEALKFKS